MPCAQLISVEKNTKSGWLQAGGGKLNRISFSSPQPENHFLRSSVNTWSWFKLLTFPTQNALPSHLGFLSKRCFCNVIDLASFRGEHDIFCHCISSSLSCSPPIVVVEEKCSIIFSSTWATFLSVGRFETFQVLIETKHFVPQIFFFQHYIISSTCFDNQDKLRYIGKYIDTDYREAWLLRHKTTNYNC